MFRILVVDDNAEIREIVKEYLTEDDCIIDGADNGKNALEKYLKNPFDIIITDLKMPEMSGIDLIKHIKQLNDVTEFIIITGYASLDTAMEAIKLGAFDYIVKPFRIEELKVATKNAKEKIALKKTNQELLDKLKSFYSELERYRQIEKKTDEQKSGEQDFGTEKIVEEIKRLERLIKTRLMIE
ncbi:MAG TPA: response regulator [Syntrophorhabdaceae bacterium]|nr:response regulator [Syntrophorhabdaceae bacterium]HPP05771.1 response regulator [Syntrophorhabdaceae bacterium]